MCYKIGVVSWNRVSIDYETSLWRSSPSPKQSNAPAAGRPAQCRWGYFEGWSCQHVPMACYPEASAKRTHRPSWSGEWKSTKFKRNLDMAFTETLAVHTGRIILFVGVSYQPSLPDGWMDGWMHGCMAAWMHGCMDIYMIIYVCVHVYACICMYMHVYAFIICMYMHV